MNYLYILFETFLLGIIVSAPLGPMGILVVQRTLNKGRSFGWVSGLGVATADVLFSFIALFGLTAIDVEIENIWFRIIGGTILIIVGILMYRTNPVTQIRKPVSGRHYINYYLTAFMLTLTNPLTILFFAASFAAMGFTPDVMSSVKYSLVIGGVFAGAVTWWTSITTFLGMFRKKIRLRSLFWINKVSGVVVFILGLISIFSVIL